MGLEAIESTPDSRAASLTKVELYIAPGPEIAAKHCLADRSPFCWARKLLLCLAGVAVAQLACPRSAAQTDTGAAATQGQSVSSYDGQNVSSVQIAGRPDYNASQCAACIVQRAGQPFSQEKVQQTASALKAAEHVSRVDIQVEPEANGVRVIFILEPAVYFGIYEFPGAKRFPYSQLIQAANYPVQEAFNPSEVEADRQSLLGFFRREGNFRADIEPQIRGRSKEFDCECAVRFHAWRARKIRIGCNRRRPRQ